MQKTFMNARVITAALTAALALSSASLAFAADTPVAGAQSAASAAKASTKPSGPSKSASAAKAKTPASAKLVDINTASKKELKTLPGIGDAQAAKIIAGRPYGSKAWLVTHDIIDGATYENIKKRIVAIQPYKDGASNAALYANKKK